MLCYARGQGEGQNVAFRLDKTRRGRPRRFRIFALRGNQTERTGWVGLNGESSCGCAGRRAEYSGGGRRRPPVGPGASGRYGEEVLALISLEYSRQLWLPCDRLTRPVTTASGLLLLELDPWTSLHPNLHHHRWQMISRDQSQPFSTLLKPWLLVGEY